MIPVPHFLVYCFVLLFLATQTLVRAYYGLCAQILLLMGLGGPMWCQGLNLGHSMQDKHSTHNAIVQAPLISCYILCWGLSI